MKITSLQYQKKITDRVNVFFDGKFFCSVGINDVIALGLVVGQEITTELQAKIIAGSELGKLYGSALNFLSFRPRSEWEIRRRLSQTAKKLEIAKPDDQINQVIAGLKNRGLVNDVEFSRWIVGQRGEFRPRGDRALRQELVQKGVDSRLAGTVVSEVAGSALIRAKSALEKKFARFGDTKLPDRAQREKMQRFLLTRGFDWETVRGAVANWGRKV